MSGKNNIVLPDTNVFILALAGKKPYSLWLGDLIVKNQLALSTIVIAEFLTGATSSEENIASALFAKSIILPVDLFVSQIAAGYRKTYLKVGKKLALPDCLIAATCKAHGATLLTLDKRGYPMSDIKVTSRFRV